MNLTFKYAAGVHYVHVLSLCTPLYLTNIFRSSWTPHTSPHVSVCVVLKKDIYKTDRVRCFVDPSSRLEGQFSDYWDIKCSTCQRV